MSYRVAWFSGRADEQEAVPGGSAMFLSQDTLLSLPPDDPRRPRLRILLIPANTDLSEVSGDDWNDAPADCNASEPYTWPEGSVWLDIRLGDTTEPWLSGYY